MNRRNQVRIGANQFEPDFFGSFNVGIELDTRSDYMKFGSPTTFPNIKNPHVYVIFVF